MRLVSTDNDAKKKKVLACCIFFFYATYVRFTKAVCQKFSCFPTFDLQGVVADYFSIGNFAPSVQGVCN